MRGAVLWVALAIMVPTRLWIAVEVSKKRDSNLTDNLMQQVRRCARSLCAILICTDGFAAYPRSIIKAFRYKGSKKIKVSKRVWYTPNTTGLEEKDGTDGGVEGSVDQDSQTREAKRI